MRAEISWCDALLSRWGRWAMRSEAGALGYAKCSVIMGAGEGDREGYADSSPPQDVTTEDFEEVSKAIGKLPKVIMLCVIQVYQMGAQKSDVYNARVLGISRRGLTEYIGQAQKMIARDISLKNREN